MYVQINENIIISLSLDNTSFQLFLTNGNTSFCGPVCIYYKQKDC